MPICCITIFLKNKVFSSNAGVKVLQMVTNGTFYWKCLFVTTHDYFCSTFCASKSIKLFSGKKYVLVTFCKTYFFRGIKACFRVKISSPKTWPYGVFVKFFSAFRILFSLELLFFRKSIEIYHLCWCPAKKLILLNFQTQS